MSKQEFLKIQTCVLKVNIHCDGCKQKVKKILQKIDGVYTINIDSEQGKVTVSGDVDPSLLIKKLTKNGKHAELWGAPNVSNNGQRQLNDHLKALQIEDAKCANNKGQNQKGGNSQPKGGPPAGQLPQLPPMKMKDLKMPPLNKDVQNQKSVRFNLPEDEGLSDEDEDEDDEDEDDDDLEDAPLSKMKPMMGHGQGGPQMPKMLMGGNAKGGGGNIPVQMNGGKGGGGNIPVQMNGGKGGGNKNNNGNNSANNQSQGGGGNGGKNVGGQPQGNQNAGGGGQLKPGAANGNNLMANVGNTGMPNMNPGGSMGLMGSLPAGQISNLQGGPLPEHLARYYQHQLAAMPMMMNQQQANGFQPMMYAHAPPPPAVNYMPSPHPYPYAPPPAHHYTMFNDEDTSSCTLM